MDIKFIPRRSPARKLKKENRIHRDKVLRICEFCGSRILEYEKETTNCPQCGGYEIEKKIYKIGKVLFSVMNRKDEILWRMGLK